VKEIDVGDPSPAVFAHLEWDVTGRPAAAFVSRFGEAFCLRLEEVELRIRFLEANALDAAEEKRALGSLREAHR
jgi:hypothetical protein